MSPAALATRPPDTSTELAAVDQLWNDEQQDVIMKMLVPLGRDGKPQVSRNDMVVFGLVCQRLDLDPFSRQVYLLPTKQGIKIHIGIDGLYAIAARSPEPISSEVYWKKKGGEWSDTWDEGGRPYAAMAVVRRGTGVHRAVVHWSEFSGSGPNWESRPAHQLGIVALRHGYRKAAPFELSGASRTIAAAGALMDERDDDPALPSDAAPRQIESPAPNGNGNGVKRDRDYYLKHWNRLLERAIKAGVDYDDLIPDFHLDKATEAELLEAGPKLRERVEAAEAQAAQAAADEPIEAELRPSAEPDEPAETLDPDAPAPEWGDNPTPEQLRAEYDALAAEALKLGVGSKAPPKDATTTQIVDAITALKPKVEAAQKRAKK